MGERMKTLYFCSYDGSLRKIFKSDVLAENWKSENGSLAFVNDVSFNDKNEIKTVNGQDFNDFVESISDEIGSDEFYRVKSNLESEWAYTLVTDD